MKKIVRLTESDLTRIVKRVINEGKIYIDIDEYINTDGGIRIVETKGGKIKLQRKGDSVICLGEVGGGFIWGDDEGLL